MAEENKVTSSKSVSIEECRIIASNGEVRDLKSPLIFNNIQIYESIHSPVVTGTIQLVEGVNLYSLLSMHGNEYFYISFSRPGERVKYARTFRIYKSSLRKPVEKSQIQTYVLHFCSDEMVFSNQQTISRSLKGESNSKHVYNILKRDLKVSDKRIQTIENSQGVQDHVLTKYKPFEAIEHLAKYSYNENESPFLFFENSNGFNFVSLQTLLNQTPVEPALNYSTARLVLSQEDAPFKNSNEVKQFEFQQSFDVLEGADKGAFANRLYTLDLIRQKYTKKDYSLVNVFSARNMVDDGFPINNAKNRNGLALYQEFNAQPNYWLTNEGQNETEYFISKRFRVNDTGIERTLLQRKMQLSMLNNTKLWCNIPGNPNLTVGFVVQFNLPSFMPNSQAERAIDPYHSGNYLITSIRHSITPDDIETVMTLNKNSVKAPLDTAAETSAYKRAREY